jgi:hypothetical protein
MNERSECLRYTTPAGPRNGRHRTRRQGEHGKVVLEGKISATDCVSTEPARTEPMEPGGGKGRFRRKARHCYRLWTGPARKLCASFSMCAVDVFGNGISSLPSNSKKQPRMHDPGQPKGSQNYTGKAIREVHNQATTAMASTSMRNSSRKSLDTCTAVLAGG